MHIRITVATALSVFFSALPVCGQSPDAPAKAEDFSSAAKLKASLARDCYILREGKLSPVAAGAFANTRLFVVYYSHITCGSCVPVTKKLNAWLEAGKAPDGVSVVLGYRAPADNKELAAYLAKSHILFPAMDTKYMRARHAGTENLHPFYADPDAGAPRFRFFLADGTEIDPTQHGATTKFGGEVLSHLDELLQKMLK